MLRKNYRKPPQFFAGAKGRAGVGAGALPVLVQACAPCRHLDDAGEPGLPAQKFFGVEFDEPLRVEEVVRDASRR